MTGFKGYYTHIAMYYATHKYDVSLAQEIQKLLSNASHKNGVIVKENIENGQLNVSGKNKSIVGKRMMM